MEHAIDFNANLALIADIDGYGVDLDGGSPDWPDFPLSEYRLRYARLQALMDAAGVGARAHCRARPAAPRSQSCTRRRMGLPQLEQATGMGGLSVVTGVAALALTAWPDLDIVSVQLAVAAALGLGIGVGVGGAADRTPDACGAS